MRKFLILLVVLGLPSGAFAASEHKSCGTVECDRVDIDLGDKTSLQRGARIFVNYCLSCHSASYMRYNRMGQDLGISDELIKENLLFAADKVGDLMKAVMPKDDAKLWFGVAPPDLSLITRSRKPEWVYTYLRSFYRDDKSPSGWNNVVFPNVAMPHVLYEWQGDQRAVYTRVKRKSHVEVNGNNIEKEIETEVFHRLELEKPGSMTAKEYDKAMLDLTHFLVYLGEPAKLVRYRIGNYVLVFLVVFLVFAYMLKKEYWKDVH
jgi:ubiquinol-cytochrome c reductase cytochrome c1 subunit